MSNLSSELEACVLIVGSHLRARRTLNVTSKALLEPPPERLDQASAEPKTQAPLSSSRVPELDGIPGVAILAVMLFHYTSLTHGLPFHSLAYRVQAAFRLGWSGVDLFFVLSAFKSEEF